MSQSPVVRAQALPAARFPEPSRDPSILESYLEDASGAPPGQAAGLLRPTSEREAASFLRVTSGRGVSILPQAARSSLTAGAIPQGEVVLTVERMAAVGAIERHPGGARVAVEPGVRLRDLQEDLASHGLYYPPVPTYQEAMLGGAVATNAGGAATFKYGVTRQWVRGLRVLLFNGDLLELHRGEFWGRRGQRFRILLSDGTERAVPVPDYSLPDLKKISAGYFSADPLDLIDLFVGSEGTLGLITEVTVEVIDLPPATVTGLVWLPDSTSALKLAESLRQAARRCRAGQAPGAPDVRAIESLDRHSLRLLKDHGDAARLRVPIPEHAGTALIFEVELPDPLSDEQAQDQLAAVWEGTGGTLPDTPLVRLCGMLKDHDALDGLDLAFPEDRVRQVAFRELREAVPTRVNEILAQRARSQPGVEKVGGDLIVPPDQLPEMLEVYEREFTRRGLEYAVWGHLSDGNLHPNALPRTAEEVQRGFEALLGFADEATRRGGCPLSEHGVGRNPVKQEMLQRFLGEGALDEMRRIRKALDPEGRFAPGVLFPP